MAAGPILIVAGTNRPGSNTQRVAGAILRHYLASGAAADVYPLADLPAEAFGPGAFADKPPALVAVQRRVLDAAGLHLVIPEYNGSFPGVLKHFVDLLKFPESFQDKPVAFTGLSAGTSGGVRGVEQMQMVFAYRNAHLFPGRVFIPAAGQKLDPDPDALPTVTDADIDRRLAEQAAGFARYAGLLAGR